MIKHVIERKIWTQWIGAIAGNVLLGMAANRCPAAALAAPNDLCVEC